MRWEDEGPVTEQCVHDADVDHNRPYHHPDKPDGDTDGVDTAGAASPLAPPPPPTGQAGQSALDNLGKLGRFHHRIKTHGSWTVRQPFAGIFLWRDPHGQIYLSDHTGTHKITGPGSGAGPATD